MSHIRTGRMTTEERAQLQALAAEGKTALEIAIALGRSFGTVNSYINRTGLQVRHRNARWSADEDRQLIDGVRRGLADERIAEPLGRSADAVHSRIGYLGGRALMLYPAGPSAPLPLPEVRPEARALVRDPYHLWTQANARLANRHQRSPEHV